MVLSTTPSLSLEPLTPWALVTHVVQGRAVVVMRLSGGEGSSPHAGRWGTKPLWWGAWVHVAHSWVWSSSSEPWRTPHTRRKHTRRSSKPEWWWPHTRGRRTPGSKRPPWSWKPHERSPSHPREKSPSEVSPTSSKVSSKVSSEVTSEVTSTTKIL